MAGEDKPSKLVGRISRRRNPPSSFRRRSGGLRLRLTRPMVLGRLLAFALVTVHSFQTPSFATEAETIEIYEYYGKYTLDAPPTELQPIVVSIPRKFLYGRSRSTPSKSWGINLLTYYPSFSSASDPGNANFGLSCIGFCNGRVLVAVANRSHSITTSSPNMSDFIARAQIRYKKYPAKVPPNAQVRELDAIGPFDEGFERKLTTLSDPGVAQIDRVYMRKSRSQTAYDLVATCRVNPSKTTCTLHFSLACNPAVYISVVGIDGSYLKLSADIQEKTDRFVSTMVRNPPCNA
jgi:hypothetical protein